MNIRSRIALASLALAAVAGTTALIAAGPLNPPSGAVTSTGKTLSEIEPRIAISATNTPGSGSTVFRISQPGSYYLTGNVAGQNGKSGIEVSASGVTIDLNGYELNGGASSFNGIYAISAVRDLVIRNGTVRNWGNHGLNTSTNAAERVELINIHFVDNGGTGVFAGQRSRIVGCTASGNAGDGVFVGARSMIERSTSVNNGGDGFEAWAYSTVRQCEARGNVGSGILTLAGASVTDCLAVENTVYGINAGSNSLVRGCQATENLSIGINAASGCRITENTTSQNDLDGIRVTSQCTVANNTSNANGVNSSLGAGIKVTGAGNFIQSNNCSAQDTGFDIDVAGNFLSRNTASGNTTNWAVIAGNKCLVILGVNAANIINDAGGTGPGSTDPNANFTY